MSKSWDLFSSRKTFLFKVCKYVVFLELNKCQKKTQKNHYQTFIVILQTARYLENITPTHCNSVSFCLGFLSTPLSDKEKPHCLHFIHISLLCCPFFSVCLSQFSTFISMSLLPCFYSNPYPSHCFVFHLSVNSFGFALLIPLLFVSR